MDYHVGIMISYVYQYEVSADSQEEAERKAISLAKLDDDSGHDYEVEYVERC